MYYCGPSSFSLSLSPSIAINDDHLSIHTNRLLKEHQTQLRAETTSLVAKASDLLFSSRPRIFTH
jgi:hypothetical protein